MKTVMVDLENKVLWNFGNFIVPVPSEKTRNILDFIDY